MDNYKAGFVGLMGLPNAGKSSLVNHLLEEELSVVTSKAQTTRQRILGIHTEKKQQVIFVDAPGFIKKTAGINNFLSKEFESIVEESDVLVAVLNIDCNDIESLKEIVEIVEKSGKPFFALITKTDLPKILRRDYLKMYLSEKNIPYLESSVRKEGWKQKFFDKVHELLPEAQAPLYDEDLYTTHNYRELTSEIIRGQCFECLHQEIPYNLAIRVRQINEGDPELVKIFAEIVLAKENHKAMVVGKSGAGIKRIGSLSREKLAKLWDRKVYLNLEVKVRKNWQKEDSFMKEFGYFVGSEKK